MEPTNGKLAGLEAVSNSSGLVAAVAIDQRGSLKKMLKGIADQSLTEDLQQIKAMVADVLTPHAYAILLDPEYGLTAAQERHGKGLFLAYEKTGYDATTPGRLPDLLDHWSVYRLKEAGADCVKALMYYTPFLCGGDSIVPRRKGV